MDGADCYKRFLQGDNDALEQLVRAYSDTLTRYAYCFLRDKNAAEDAMEDTFATLIVKRKRFTERKGSFEAYLFRIARNKCLDVLRRRKPISLSELDGEYESIAASDCVEQSSLNRMRDGKVFECMMKLTEQYRDVLYLTYFEDFSVDEIKRATGKNAKQIYNLLARAKSALKQILLKEGIGYEDI